MITVEIDDADESVALYVDADGGKLLLELLEALVAKAKNDHFHLTDYSLPADVKIPHPAPPCLTLNKVSQNETAQVASMLTVVYRPEGWPKEI